MRMQRDASRFLAAGVLFLLACAAGHAAAAQNDSDKPQANELRFRVAHHHPDGACAGYLYVSQEKVGYKVVAPNEYQKHSFEIGRAEITVLQPWLVKGQTRNLVEIKTAHASYHFWLLPKNADLQAAPGSDLNHAALPAEKLIAAIRNPEVQLKRAAAKPTASDAGAASPAGDKPPAGSLEGIYVGFGIEHAHLQERAYYFTADGWVINNIPRVHMDNFDMAAYRKDPNNKLFVGRYRVDGNKINIVWSNNADRRDVIKYNPTGANPALDTYIPTCRCTGKTFSGRYHWPSPTDPRYVQFLPDGTFVDHGLTDQVVDPNPHGYAGLTDPPRDFRGTYSVKNQKLTFNFADGKHATLAFIAPQALEKASKFEWIGLGHGTGVKDAETVIVLMLYEEHYHVQP